jgi:hypothetical protein
MTRIPAVGAAPTGRERVGLGVTMRGLPGADEDRIATFKAYLERQVAANHDFVEKLLRAKDFHEAFRIQVEYFQSQLKGVAESASKIGAQIASSFNRPTTG